MGSFRLGRIAPGAIVRRLRRNHSPALSPYSRGHDLFRELAPTFGGNEARITALDIGANVGEWSATFCKTFPNGTVFGFEPNPTLHALYRERLAPFGARATLVPVAVGAEARQIELILTDNHTISVVADNQRSADALPVPATGERVTAEMITIDSFISTQNIERCDLIKIDTEGYEMQVFEGMRNLLETGKVGAIECELGMSSKNQFHTPFDQVRPRLNKLGFEIFGFYEQIAEWSSNSKSLRRLNCVFVREIKDAG